jgi:hypothetical protein
MKFSNIFLFWGRFWLAWLGILISRSADPPESGSISEPDPYPKHCFYVTKLNLKIEPTGKTSLEDCGPKQKIKGKQLLMVSLVHFGTYFKI